MTTIERNRKPHDVDGLLREFFKAEMPHPWPVMKPPMAFKSTLPFRAQGWSLMRSRLALAASIALLLLGSWFLASGLPVYTHPSVVPDGTESIEKPDRKFMDGKTTTTPAPGDKATTSK